MYRLKYCGYGVFGLLLCFFAGCTTANHGTFVPSTYVEQDSDVQGQMISEVTGISSQTWFLYIFPLGEPPSTSKAISDAKSKYEGTKYLTDLAIDDRMYWGFGYSQQVISVEAKAYD